MVVVRGPQAAFPVGAVSTRNDFLSNYLKQSPDILYAAKRFPTTPLGLNSSKADNQVQRSLTYLQDDPAQHFATHLEYQLWQRLVKIH